jgi:SAM-dependent methyltransferase
LAREFVPWLGLPPGGRWLDAGCGTGALTRLVLGLASPALVLGIDRSEGFVRYARQQVRDDHAMFAVGDAQALPVSDGSCDAVVCGLVLNFIPDQPRALAEMVRVVRSGGVVACYVWDYAGQMQMMRYFWHAAAALDPEAARLDEGVRFPVCRPGPLERLFAESGLRGVQVRAIDAPTHFRDFDDYWSPFLGGQGPAPGYVMSLSEERRVSLRERIRAALPVAEDGSIPLMARAWAVRGFVSGDRDRGYTGSL